MLAENIIKSEKIAWAALIVFVPRKKETIRFCVDYYKLNAKTKRDSYSTSCIEECIVLLGQATVFSMLDAISGYWKIKIKDADKDSTEFTLHRFILFHLYSLCSMKCPETFQHTMKCFYQASNGNLNFLTATTL